MVVKCSVIGCSNRKDREKDLHFYRLPAVESNQGDEWTKLCSDRRREWLAKINQNFEDKNVKNVRICSAHFVSGQKALKYDRNNPDWVPSVGLCGQKAVETPETPRLQRYNRVKGRTSRKLSMTPIQEIEELVPEPEEICSSSRVTSTQTAETSAYVEGMQRELHILRQENRMLRLASVDKFSVEDLENDDEKVNNITGISTFATLMILFEYLEPYMIDSQLLTKFQVLVMTLMRLRVNVSVTFLGYTFRISAPNVSRLFLNTIECLYERLHPCVYWPRREELELTMPMQFRQHFNRKCISVIDCFEVFIERPSNLEARMETWSSYKHHNTVKFLVGITPQGTVSYISKAWAVE